MLHSMGDMLRSAEPRLAPGLAASGQLDLFAPLLELLPPLVCLFESHLTAPEPRADLLFRLIRTDQRHGMLLRDGPLFRRRPDLLQAPAWRHLSDFAAAWSEPASALNRDVPIIWLEFDAAETRRPIPTPCFFIEFNPQSQDRPAATQQMLDLFTGGWPDPCWAAIERCLALLPAAGLLFSAGLMLSRQPGRARLCLAGIPAEQIGAYLSRIGWPGDQTAVHSDLQRFGPCADHVALALDVGADVGPQLGVEYHNDGSLNRTRERWGALIERLVCASRCPADRGQAALAWIGHTRLARQPAPGDTESQTARPASELAVRQISHLKLVYGPNCPVHTKAYLQLSRLWLRFDAGQQQYQLVDLSGPA